MAPFHSFLFGTLVLLSSNFFCSGFVTPVSSVVSTTANPRKCLLQAIPPEFSQDVFDSVSTFLSDSNVPEAGGVSYSKASYYTVLGLYLFSFPGLWSTIKRSTTAKMKRKTYVTWVGYMSVHDFRCFTTYQIAESDCLLCLWFIVGPEKMLVEAKAWDNRQAKLWHVRLPVTRCIYYQNLEFSYLLFCCVLLAAN